MNTQVDSNGITLNTYEPSPQKRWRVDCNGPVKCDAEDCGFTTAHNVASHHLYKYLNTKCPRCGANLLTQADYDNVIMINKVLCNPIVRALNWIGIKLAPNSKKQYRVTMKGTGEMEIKSYTE
jgi:hypothetical protein